MDRDLALAKIRSVEGAFRKVGVKSAMLFGSLARGARDAADIDVAVTPMPGMAISPRQLLTLYGILGAEFGYHVPLDIVVLPVKNRALGAAIERESVLAFS